LRGGGKNFFLGDLLQKKSKPDKKMAKIQTFQKGEDLKKMES
jgi:hypothetical protein